MNIYLIFVSTAREQEISLLKGQAYGYKSSTCGRTPHRSSNKYINKHIDGLRISARLQSIRISSEIQSDIFVSKIKKFLCCCMYLE